MHDILLLEEDGEKFGLGAEDIVTFLTMAYYCAEGQRGRMGMLTEEEVQDLNFIAAAIREVGLTTISKEQGRRKWLFLRQRLAARSAAALAKGAGGKREKCPDGRIESAR